MLKIKEAIFAALGFRYLLYAELEISFFSCPRKHYQKKKELLRFIGATPFSFHTKKKRRLSGTPP
jgi:hypothetical protein